jgi:hypothetical protein
MHGYFPIAGFYTNLTGPSRTYATRHSRPRPLRPPNRNNKFNGEQSPPYSILDP